MKKFFLIIIVINFISLLYGQDLDYSKYKDMTYDESVSDFIQGNQPYQDYTNEGFYKSKVHFVKTAPSRKDLECIIMTGGHTLFFYIDRPVSTENIKPGDVIIVYYHKFWSSRTVSRTVIKKIDRTNESFIIGNKYYVCNNINLRKGEGVTYDKIKLLKVNDNVILTGIGKQDIIDGKKSYWLKVKTEDGIIGWCYGGYLDYWNIYLEYLANPDYD
jgi:hypothetical protein